jgi:3-hydroxyisobutyrate dehydrogenase
MKDTSRRVAVLGTGAMGSRVAANLVDAGFAVRVYNRTRARAEALRQRGIAIADTPRDAVQDCQAAIGFLRDDEASEFVWLDEKQGAVNALARGAVAIESSTVSPACVTQLAERIHVVGADFLDAPVIGSRPQAEARKLISLVGGNAAVLDSVREFIEVSSPTIHHVGPLGTGSALKLAVNAYFATQVAAIAELLSLMQSSGIDATRALGIVSDLPTTSLAAKGAGALMIANDASPLFPIELVEKDLSYALVMAHVHGLRAELTQRVHSIFQQARRKGFGAMNITAISEVVNCETLVSRRAAST